MPRPGLQVMTRYTSYTHLDPLLTRCPCWPASTANQSGLVTLTFDLLTLKVVSQSRVTWATAVPILVFLDLSVLDLGPMYATHRQTDARQHHRLMPPPRGRGQKMIRVSLQCTAYSLCGWRCRSYSSWPGLVIAGRVNRN